MHAEADLALGLAVAPPEVDPALYERPTALLGAVGRGVEGGLRTAEHRREGGGLHAEARRGSGLPAQPDLWYPEPEVARGRELGRADRGERHRVERRDEL